MQHNFSPVESRRNEWTEINENHVSTSFLALTWFDNKMLDCPRWTPAQLAMKQIIHNISEVMRKRTRYLNLSYEETWVLVSRCEGLVASLFSSSPCGWNESTKHVGEGEERVSSCWLGHEHFTQGKIFSFNISNLTQSTRVKNRKKLQSQHDERNGSTNLPTSDELTERNIQF